MRNVATPSDLIFTSEAARILGVSAQAVRLWETNGRLHATKTAGGVRLFVRGDIEQLAQEREQRRSSTPEHPEAA